MDTAEGATGVGGAGQVTAGDQLAMVRPAYGDGSLSDLLPSVLAALHVPGARDRLGLTDQLAGVRRVVVLLLDGFGYHQLPLAATFVPLLSDVVEGRLGELRSLTTTFPSTTPTSITSLGVGASPGEHGVIGFTVNIPSTDRLLTHINWRDDPDPLQWQPLPTQFARAAAAGVAVGVVARSDFVGSGLTTAALRGGDYRPADDPTELVRQLLGALNESTPPVLIYGYHLDVDRQGHEHGVDSGQWRSAVTDVGQLLHQLASELPGDAALLVTADHGQLNVPDDQRFDLAADPRLRAGVRLVAGEPRVRYLHTVPGATDDVIARWRAVLGEAAWVTSREEVVADGWFGPVAPPHLARLGDVVAVCRDRYAIFATGYEPPSIGRLIGLHGSWTAAEMRIPLLVIRSPRG